MAQSIAYVKFQRGTPEAFAKLSFPDRDVLYFISERGATDGKLYLGDQLIAGSSLGDLNDVNLNELEDNSLLIYKDGKWSAIDSIELLKDTGLIRVMKPATETEDGLAGYVPQPLAGDPHRYLNAEGHWETVVASITDEDREYIIEKIRETISEITWGTF